MCTARAPGIRMVSRRGWCRSSRVRRRVELLVSRVVRRGSAPVVRKWVVRKVRKV